MFIPMNTTIPSQVTLREMLISLQHTLRLLDYVMMWNIYSLTLSLVRNFFNFLLNY